MKMADFEQERTMEAHMGTSSANRLKELRQARGLPLWGLAVRAGTTATTLSAVERWGYEPSPELCQRIAAALEVSVEAIWPEGRTTA
jgi:DNA-binding XRE family transcriptional regulator